MNPTERLFQFFFFDGGVKMEHCRVADAQYAVKACPAENGNVYCCNTVGNTRLGVSVSGGSLATDNFRGTTFGNHATSLYLPDVNAVLGSQSHTQNKWTGTGAAVYGVSQQLGVIVKRPYPRQRINIKC